MLFLFHEKCFISQELSVPLRTYTENFPKRRDLHPYERSLIELTFGEGYYEQVWFSSTLFVSFEDEILRLSVMAKKQFQPHMDNTSLKCAYYDTFPFYLLSYYDVVGSALPGSRTSRCSQEKDYFCRKATCFSLC